ncbi:Chitin deacetylase [Psilocybe cubensis]|uniref:Chitin deacetylase n=2 Tax=Psilocybe cubensis TaxID=181762 RepID=A0ACB8GZQ5_PSICU|nr:Chitin deacetylase [Psilocybe cubensis]KAH9481066.1 Chitin deacetylase [Psilocybe cubensis]
MGHIYTYGCIYDSAMVKRVQYAYDNGFQVASHTWAHKDLTTLNHDQRLRSALLRKDVNSEMSRTEEAIRKITGATPAYTRPPYGNVNDDVYTTAGARGQTLVTWDFDSGDSTGSTVEQQKQAYEKLVKKRPKSVLSLEHEVYETTAHQVLPYVISKMQAAGYRLVTLSECLGTSPYLKVEAAEKRDVS